MEPMTEEQPTNESPPVEETKTQKRPRLSSQFAIIAVVIVVILVLAFNFWPTYRRNVLERAAKGTLREIGRAQLAYQGSNNNKLYGSFEVLQGSGYIAENATKENLANGYRISWECPYWDWDIDPYECGEIGSNRFTIIAYPRYYPPNLHTFAISEDQKIRIFNPDNRSRVNSITSWDIVERYR